MSAPDWSAYFKAVAGKPARETAAAALDAFEREPPAGRVRCAVDLGCGEGRDAVELLRRGWAVVAIDSSPEALLHLERRVTPDDRRRLTTVLGSYEDVHWGTADLVNASYSIPHCREGAFAGVWRKIVTSLGEGGRFAGHLFGVRDGWRDGDAGAHAASPPSGSREPGWRDGRDFLTREMVEGMLLQAGLEAELFNEQEGPGATALGDAKYWHVFHIVARRR